MDNPPSAIPVIPVRARRIAEIGARQASGRRQTSFDCLFGLNPCGTVHCPRSGGDLTKMLNQEIVQTLP
jgi:hypothetical protein